MADAILADAVMAGEKPILPEVLPVNGLRILPKDYLLADMEPDVAAHFEASLAALEKAGAIIADLAVDDLIGRLKEATRIGSIAGIERKPYSCFHMARRSGRQCRYSGQAPAFGMHKGAA